MDLHWLDFLELTRSEDGVNVFHVLRKGLEDLASLCDGVVDEFTEARDEHDRANPDERQASVNS